MKNIKGQMWITDFIIATVIFSLMVVIYIVNTSNLSTQDSQSIEDLIKDSQFISDSLLSPGLPNNWDKDNVVSVGITNNNNLINRTKLLRFKNLNYSQSKKKFGITNNYFIYFTENNGTPLSVDGVCGIGSPLVNSSYSTKIAYYFDSFADSNLMNFMEEAGWNIHWMCGNLA